MRRLLLLPVLALMGVMLVASPASAATVDSFTVSAEGIDPTPGPVTVEPGTPVQLAWAITPGPEELVDISAGSSGPTTTTFTGPRDGDFVDGALRGSESVTLDAVGVYTFTITADGANSEVSTASITVTVAETVPDTIIPVPDVQFPEPCVAVLPADPNVSYGVNYGQSGNALEPGTVDLAELLEFGIPLEIVAVPNEGFAFPEGADNRFELPDLEDCFGDIVESGLVRAEAVCQGVTFTNVADTDLFVVYGGDEDGPDGEFELAVGASRTVDTDRDLVFYVALSDTEPTAQINEVEVEQDCTRVAAAAAHPTVAPAAGSDGGSATGLGALAALMLAGGAVLGARRLRHTA